MTRVDMKVNTILQQTQAQTASSTLPGGGGLLQSGWARKAERTIASHGPSEEPGEAPTQMPEADVMRLLTDSKGWQNPAGVKAALHALRTPAGVLGVIVALKDSDVDVRATAAQALGKIGPAAKKAVPDLLTALRDEDEDVRAAAAAALGKIGPVTKEVVPALTEALKDPAYIVRANAVGALGRIGPAANAATPALRALRNKCHQIWIHTKQRRLEALDAICFSLPISRPSREVGMRVGRTDPPTLALLACDSCSRPSRTYPRIRRFPTPQSRPRRRRPLLPERSGVAVWHPRPFELVARLLRAPGDSGNLHFGRLKEPERFEEVVWRSLPLELAARLLLVPGQSENLAHGWPEEPATGLESSARLHPRPVEFGFGRLCC
jgi:hypothetical protein